MVSGFVLVWCRSRLFLRSWLLLLGGLVAIESQAAQLQNVVLIMADDIGYECFSSYGSREYQTPRLDRLAAEGIRFEHCHSTPLCTPSRVKLLSGKANVYNYQDFGVFPKGEQTIANYFREHGYATAVAGKWQLLTSKGGIGPTEAGFDTYCVWNTPMTTRSRYWDPSYEQNGALLNLPKGTYGPDVMTDFLIQFIEAQKAGPFFAYYPMNLVHNPFPPTPDSADPNETDPKKNFVDMVAYMDKCVGRIVDVLEEADLLGQTLVVFTGDNGTNAQLSSELHGETVPGGKGYTRDHGTHVPLIVYGKGWVKAGQVSDDLIGFSDFFPTLVEAVGLPPAQIVDGDGISFWPQCRGKLGKKRTVLFDYYFPRPYAKAFDDKYQHFEIRYARDHRFKVYSDGRVFDTQADVLEKRRLSVPGLSSSERATVARLQQYLDEFPEEGRGIDYSRVTAGKSSVDQR